MLVQMAISRRREFEADRSGAELSAGRLARLRASSASTDRPLPSTIPKQTRTPRLRICSLSIRCVVGFAGSSRVIRPRRNVIARLGEDAQAMGQETKKPASGHERIFRRIPAGSGCARGRAAGAERDPAPKRPARCGARTSHFLARARGARRCFRACHCQRKQCAASASSTILCASLFRARRSSPCRCFARDSPGGRVRASVSRRARPCGRRRGKPSCSVRFKGCSFQAADQRRVAPDRARRAIPRTRSGRLPSQHARLAMVTLVRSLWRRDGARFREGSRGYAAARPCLHSHKRIFLPRARGGAAEGGGGSNPAKGTMPTGSELPGGMLRLENAGNVTGSPGFGEGEFWVQDFRGLAFPFVCSAICRGRRASISARHPAARPRNSSRQAPKFTAVDRDPGRVAGCRKTSTASVSTPDCS